ncbi:unnamed protein product [Fraxinus pennsylvanica]|uniref:NAC domain-containing protein n=1 Tax=Fraxinus pennsylvanica TaxID=56036 RepID=A0AAD1ZDV0_9LAMI|nr:unnamed protein product [Fraxinus pennsylvanica]
MWILISNFEHHTISENPILIDNPAAGNVDPALVLPENNALPENNPPIAPVVAGNEMAPIVHPHFNPDERRFVIEFVAKRLRNEPLEEEHRIQEINFYDYPPQHLAANYIHGKPGILYFFTPVRRRSNGQAIRSIPAEWGGKWSRVGGFVQNIKSNDGVVFNIKSYKFVPKHPSPNDISWLMKEYSLSTEEIQPHSNNIHECVAVKLYRK